MTEQGDEICVSFQVKNTGKRAGDEVPQLYVKTPEEGGPLKQLKGFARTTIQKGESKRITITVPKKDLRHWEESSSRYVMPTGKYQFMIGASSADIRLQTELSLTEQ